MVQQDLARLTRAGDPAGGLAKLMTAMLPMPLRAPIYPLARMLTRAMAPEDPSDMLVTLEAEDAFDVANRLDEINAPTLVIGGGKDVFYPRELFEETATGVKDGRAHIYPSWGHMRTSTSATTANITLGFMLAARTSQRPPRRPHHP